MYLCALIEQSTGQEYQNLLVDREEVTGITDELIRHFRHLLPQLYLLQDPHQRLVSHFRGRI